MSLMRTFRLQEPIIFDNDCLACFLWTNRVELLYKVLAGRNIQVPDQVVAELKYLNTTNYAWVYGLLDKEIQKGRISILSLEVTEPAAKEYTRLIDMQSHKPMGWGEAAVLAAVRFRGGTVASNNLADVHYYCMR